MKVLVGFSELLLLFALYNKDLSFTQVQEDV